MSETNSSSPGENSPINAENAPDRAESTAQEVAEHAEAVADDLNAGIDDGLAQLDDRVEGMDEARAEAVRQEAELLADEMADADSADAAERVLNETPLDISNRLFAEDVEAPEQRNFLEGIIAFFKSLVDRFKYVLGDFNLIDNPDNNEERPRQSLEARGLRRSDEIADLSPDQRQWYDWGIEASRAYNIPADAAVPIMFGFFESESGFDPTRMNGGSMADGSTATGLGQFLNGTWESFIEDEGRRMVELGVATESDITDPKDVTGRVRTSNPRLMIYATNWLLAKNFRSLQRNGVVQSWYDPDIGIKMYTGHHLGARGAREFWAYIESGDSRETRDETIFTSDTTRVHGIDHWYASDRGSSRYYHITGDRINGYRERFTTPSNLVA